MTLRTRGYSRFIGNRLRTIEEPEPIEWSPATKHYVEVPDAVHPFVFFYGRAIRPVRRGYD